MRYFTDSLTFSQYLTVDDDLETTLTQIQTKETVIAQEDTIITEEENFDPWTLLSF